MKKLIDGLLAKRNILRQNFAKLFHRGVPIVPIPFFGDIKTAKIVTIGANPSADELRENNWSESMSSTQIEEKLLNYFYDNQHKWFDTWEEALNIIGFSYRDGTAAHIDLCPWATKSLSSLDPNEAVELFVKYAYAFVEVMNRHVHADFLLMAGTVTKKYYLDAFLGKFVNVEEFRLETNPVAKPGGSFANQHTILLKNRSVKALFSSTSPSAFGDKKNTLPRLVKENKNFILKNM